MIMNTTELLWFTVGISGFVIFMQGAVNYIGDKVFKVKHPGIANIIGGAVILTLALLKLFEVF